MGTTADGFAAEDGAGNNGGSAPDATAVIPERPRATPMVGSTETPSPFARIRMLVGLVRRHVDARDVTLAIGGAVVVFESLLFIARRFTIAWFMPPTEVLVASGGLALLVGWRLVGRTKSVLLRWSRRRRVLAADVFLAGLIGLSGYAGLHHLYRPGWSPMFIAVATLGSAALATRAALTTRIRYGTIPSHPASDRLAEILGSAGFQPLPDLTEDRLDRIALVDTLESLVVTERRQPLNVGLSGPWGSGKTTLLNDLARRLEDTHIIVRFDAWGFREPNRMVEAYFAALDAALRRWTFLPGFRRRLRVLARDLGAVGDRYSRIANAILRTEEVDAVEDIRADVREELAALDRPVVVIVDDLDRLDAPELGAALRAIRLVSDLQITHVLAYDRAEMSRILFPSDELGTRGRDYLAKLVSIELTVPPPRREAQVRLLDESLSGLLREVGDDVSRRLTERLRGCLPAVLLALRTPRDMKRVVAATAGKWTQLKPDVNLLDLLILTVIQIQFPSVYDTMSDHPEWFFHLDWAQDLGLLFRRKEVEEAAAHYGEKLKSERDGPTVTALLAELFPSNGAYSDVPRHLSSAEARRGRRIAYPAIMARYFQLALSDDEIPESVVDENIKAAMGMPEGAERQTAITSIFTTPGTEALRRSLFHQWEVLGPDLDEDVQRDDATIRDLVLGIARAMSSIPGHPDEILAPHSVMTMRAMKLLSEVSTQEIATELAVEAANTTDDFDFVGDLVFYTCDAEPSRVAQAFPRHVPDGVPLRQILDTRLTRRYRDEGYSLADAPYGELASAVYRVSPHILDDCFVQGILRDPALLARIVRMAAKELRSLNEHVDLDRLYDAFGYDLASPLENKEDAQAIADLAEWFALRLRRSD